jgi:hypothetical protein
MFRVDFGGRSKNTHREVEEIDESPADLLCHAGDGVNNNFADADEDNVN